MDSFQVNIIAEDYSVIVANVPGAAIGGNPEYPAEWFKANKGKKPPVNTPKPIIDISTWRKYLGYTLNNSLISNVVIAYMVEYIGENYGETLESTWSSYGVRIGEKGNTITPLDLLDIKENDKDWTGTEGIEISGDERFRLFATLIAGYRYGLAAEVVQGELS